MLTHVDLFSGIGGFSLAAEWAGFTTVAFCECDLYCQAVLKKHWPEVPIVERIQDFKWPLAVPRCERQKVGKKSSTRIEQFNKEHISRKNGGRTKITLLTGGFPCQPFSIAGKRRGTEDDRWLWPEMFRVIKEVRPCWVLGENVAGIVRMALDDCLADLESEGYSTQAFIIPACAVNAPHRRDRVWIVAHDTKSRLERKWKTSRKESDGFRQSSWWDVEPDVGRVAHGIPSRMDCLKCLGNAIVPQVAYQILKGIAEIENGN